MADLGPEIEVIEVEPVPLTVPVEAPSPAPAPAPVEEPVLVPA